MESFQPLTPLNYANETTKNLHQTRPWTQNILAPNIPD